MSEYQYVAFRAVDRPLTDRELKFAEQQSTRARITRWSFENEYHFGDFRGDAKGLLRHGYDVHLHYANFGIRAVAFRMPAGLPFPKSVWSPYIGIGELEWESDPRGHAGIVSLSPYRELDGIEEIWNPGEYMDDMVELRSRLIAGDLRALYVLWLCAAMDDQSVERDVVEPPVPGGLAQAVEVFGPVLEFFGLDPLLLLAAAERSPDAVEQPTHDQQCREWMEHLTNEESSRLLRRFVTEDANAVKAETIAAIRQGGKASDWPTASSDRSFQELLARTEEIRADHEATERKKREAATKREAAKRERERQERMKEMVKDPQSWLRKASKLVEARGTANYKAAAEMLADLREAVGGEKGEKLTRRHAAQLAKKHPTLTHLKGALRKRGLLE